MVILRQGGGSGIVRVRDGEEMGKRWERDGKETGKRRGRDGKRGDRRDSASFGRAIPSRSPRGPVQRMERHHRPHVAAGVFFAVSRLREQALDTPADKKRHRSCAAMPFHPLRKKGDSNPRYPVKGIPVFETSAFSHSAILP